MDLPDSQLLDAAPDPIVVMDGTGTIVLVNQQAEIQFGYSREELIGRTLETLVPERLRARHVQHRQRYMRKPWTRTVGEKLDVELLCLRKDGTEFQAEISLSPIESEQGLFVASAIRDITQRVAEDHKLKQLLDSSADSMIVVDVDGEVVLVNSQTESLFGYSRDELVGNSIERLIPDRFRDSHPAHRAAFIKDPHVRPMGQGRRLYGRKSNGEEFPIEVSLSPVHTANGLLVSSAIRDVSYHIEAEKALTAARDAAEKANIGKSRFLAAASHDLRQPLQSLGLYLSVMARQSDTDKRQEIMGKMRQSLDTMGNLLDALLDISKLDGGSVVPEKRDFHVRELLDRIVTDNIQQAEEKGLLLECTGENCVVHSDPALLERVVENFVTNAIRYTEHGRVRIACECDADAARISVIDSGIGMPEDSLKNIFDEYYQLDNDVRDRRKGLGLGLAIVKHVSQLLEHPLEVSSTLGKGSTFSIDVPLGSSCAEQETAPQFSRSIVESDHVPTVLFVDDDPAIVDATTMLLQSAGLSVHSALNGDEALAHIGDGVRPDLVISDYRLPNYNGVEVVRRVRRATVNNLPIILMTGDTSTKEIEAANLEHCTILHKPVDTERLIGLIESLTE